MTTTRDAGMPPSTGEWAIVLAAITIPVRDLAMEQVPEEPGVYVWRHDGKVVYVGTAKRLRGRAWSKHLGRGRSLAGSSLRRNVCELLFGIPPAVTNNPNREMVTAEQAAAIRSWLGECDLSWQVCTSAREASELEALLREVWLPPLNRV